MAAGTIAVMAAVLPKPPSDARMLIARERVAAEDGRVMPTFDPSTGTQIAEVPLAGERDVDRAVRAARAAVPAWAAMDARARGRLLLEVATRARAATERLAALDALNAGITLKVARRDVGLGATRVEYMAELAQETKGETFVTPSTRLTYTIRQPYGVVAVIFPFNHPVMFALAKSAAPLAAGNCVVLKAPDQAPLSCLELAAIVAEVLPLGVFNVVTGSGPVTGAALAGHSEVGKIAFTGSVRTGQAILEAAAPNIVPALLELGGKNAFIVFPDADLDRAVKGAVDGMNLSVCGQSCTSASRVFLHESIRDAFMDRFVAEVEKVRIGRATEEATEMGPLVSERQLAMVRSYVELGAREGARLVTGGSAPDDEALRGGYFIRPTVFDRVDMSMRIARDEIFGPVLSVLTWRDEREMLDSVNSLRLGLTASVWTRSLRAHEVAREIEAGYVYINQHGGTALGVPFGGWKQSGIGAEHSRDTLLDFTRIKVVDTRMA
jgi:betaine-aldehyde dehydrogenase